MTKIHQVQEANNTSLLEQYQDVMSKTEFQYKQTRDALLFSILSLFLCLLVFILKGTSCAMLLVSVFNSNSGAVAM